MATLVLDHARSDFDRSEANRQELQRWYREGTLSSGISAGLHEGGKAIQLLADRSAVGKIVVTI